MVGRLAVYFISLADCINSWLHYDLATLLPGYVFTWLRYYLCSLTTDALRGTENGFTGQNGRDELKTQGSCIAYAACCSVPTNVDCGVPDTFSKMAANSLGKLYFYFQVWTLILNPKHWRTIGLDDRFAIKRRTRALLVESKEIFLVQILPIGACHYFINTDPDMLSCWMLATF